MQDEFINKTGVGGYQVNNNIQIVKMNTKNNKREENKESQQINSTNKLKKHTAPTQKKLPLCLIMSSQHMKLYNFGKQSSAPSRVT